VSRSPQSDITFTQQAVDDLSDIYNYSLERWGKRTADKYLSEINAAIQRIQEHPDLLIDAPDLPEALRFYNVNKHLLICDVESKSIVVLTVVSTYRDIPNLLAKLQLRLSQEAKILHQRLRKSTRKRS